MKHLFALAMLLCAINCVAQDVIVKKNGSTVVCRVMGVNNSEVVYKKWSDLNGSNYIMNLSDVTSINYENGRKQELSNAQTNEFAPHNQNTGMQTLNDNVLLNMDIDNQRYNQRAQKLRTIGWIGGSVLLVGGGICAVIAQGEAYFFGSGIGEASIALAGAGVVWTTYFLIKANSLQNNAKQIVMANPVIQHDFAFNNGTSLSGGVDLLKDNITRHHTLGIGLRYNF